MPMVVAREAKRASAAVVIFVTSAAALIRISSFAADRILLLWIYGRHRLLTEHLAIIEHKPKLIVSNGDVLYGKGFPLYLIGVSLWIPSTALFLLLILRFLPDREREALKGDYSVSTLTIPVVIALFFAIGLLKLEYSVLLAVFVVAITLMLPWVRKELRSSR